LGLEFFGEAPLSLEIFDGDLITIFVGDFISTRRGDPSSRILGGRPRLAPVSFRAASTKTGFLGGLPRLPTDPLWAGSTGTGSGKTRFFGGRPRLPPDPFSTLLVSTETDSARMRFLGGRPRFVPLPIWAVSVMALLAGELSKITGSEVIKILTCQCVLGFAVTLRPQAKILENSTPK
jgi:hypothetical protein